MKQKMYVWFSTAILLLFVAIFIPETKIFAKEVVLEVTSEGGEEELIVGDSGKFTVPETVFDDEESKTVDSVRYNCASSDVLSVSDDGAFTALAPGSARVKVSVYVKYDAGYDSDDWEPDDDDYEYGYDEDETGTYCLFTAYYNFIVKPDLSNVTLTGNQQTKYILEDDWNMPDFTFSLNSDVLLSESDDSYLTVSYESSNQSIPVEGELYNNVITLTPEKEGKTTVTITINEKQFKVTIKTVKVSITKNSLLMSTKQTKQLKIKGVKKGVKWSSSNAKIVKVSSSGKLKAKKNGNVVIKATVGDLSLGCAVSVVSPGRAKVIRYAIKIGKTCTYSQAKRMQKNYYDCSSLTWKSYKKIGITFGDASYAPPAANQGQWCAKKKKLVKGGLSAKNIRKMKINAGDLMFETGSDNGRFRGIYHVEMISGYICYGFSGNGKPILGITWANRIADYYYPSGQMLGRP